jgi:sialic acid synthase SpsE
MLARYRLPDSDIRAVVAAALSRDLPVFATPFDEASLALLVALELPVIKIGSGEVTHTPFLAQVARAGRPLILSTGAATWPDIDRAVETLRAHGAANLSLLHCVSAYPPPDDQTHLRVIPRLAQRFPDCTIGFSDHSLGSTAAIAAVALGARIIEKHLTLDTAAPGPDHAASADPPAFAALVTDIRRAEALLGHDEKSIQPCEGTIGRSIVAAHDLPAGHTLTPADFAFKRPGHGLRPHATPQLLGRRTTRPLQRDALIFEPDVL